MSTAHNNILKFIDKRFFIAVMFIVYIINGSHSRGLLFHLDSSHNALYINVGKGDSCMRTHTLIQSHSVCSFSAVLVFALYPLRIRNCVTAQRQTECVMYNTLHVRDTFKRSHSNLRIPNQHSIFFLRINLQTCCLKTKKVNIFSSISFSH